MKKLAICFHDNDFYNTFIPLLETIHRATKFHSDDGGSWKEDKIKTKEQWASLINQMIGSHYVLFQNPFAYNGLEKDTELTLSDEYEHIVKYLNIEPATIMLDKEVDEYIKKTPWNNSETYILDTTLYNNNVYTI